MNRTRVGLALAVLWLAPTAIAISGDTFWDGGKITDHLDEATAAKLHDFLVDEIVGELNMTREANTGAGLVVYDPKKAWNGFTLLGAISGDACPDQPEQCAAILIDMNGNTVKTWPLKGQPVKMLPNGHLMGGTGRGFGSDVLKEVDFCGNEVWRHEGDWHHDFGRLDIPVYATGRHSRHCRELGNRTLILSNEQVDRPEIGGTRLLLDDTIYEIDDVGNVNFEWHAWEHFEQMGFTEGAKQAIKDFRVGPPRGNQTDWTHANNVAYVGPNKWYYWYKDQRFHPENIIFDFRTSNILGIIARHPHPDGDWDEGDIVWKVGPHYTTGYPERNLRPIIGPHMFHLIPWNLPGGGNALVFDNGGTAGYGSLITGLPQGVYPNTYRNYSRVVEFNPKTLEIEWEYTSPEATAEAPWFFSRLVSGMQRFPNGNTMITEGGSGRIFEVTRKGEIVWEYYNTVCGRSNIPVGNCAVYRAYRVPHSWLWKGYKECAVP